MPSVSIILPMYNVERYINICLKSILAQSFQDFEIIIVDDASTDNSFQICQKNFGDNPKIKILQHEKNQGLGPARNTGIKNARGKYVCLVDSDDAILPNALEILYNAAENSGAEIVHFSRYYETTQDDDQPFEVKKFTLEKDPHQTEGFITTDRIFRWQNCWQHFKDADGIRPMAWLNFYRRDIFQKYNLYFEPMISEDEVFFFEILAYVEKFFVINQPLYIYRRRKDSIMGAKNLKKMTKGISAFLVTIDKIKAVMNRFPALRGKTDFQERFIYKLLDTLWTSYVKPLYQNGLSQEVDSAVESALQETFGKNTTFVKYLFHATSDLRVRIVNVSAQANQLYIQKQILSNDILKTLHRCPITKNKIVFGSFNGRGYFDSPKYIAEEILRQNLPYDLVWLVKDMNELMPEKIRKVLYNSLDAAFELSTSKVIIENVKDSFNFIKKPDQFFIETWHGDPGFAFKEIQGECADYMGPNSVAYSKRNSAMTNLMITSTDKGFDIMRNYFWYDGKIMKSGLPRSDILYNYTEEFVADMKKRLNIPPKNKVLMYAPTYRDTNFKKQLEMYSFDTEKLLTTVQKKFGGEWTLLLRFHPQVVNMGIAEKLFKTSDKIIDVTQYPDPQELACLADICISDYSSIIYDFLVIDKPVFIFAKDIDTYPKERRLRPRYFELPLKKNKTEDELFNCIKNFDAKSYRRKIKEFMSKTFELYDDGHASERIVDVIKSVIDGTYKE